ncbi:hypothetical protein BH11ARM1_BH11ARM1_05510 [soil metagenome]
MKRLALLLVLGFTAAIANAQSFEQYLALRKQYKISSAAPIAAIESFVGNKTIEIQGVVKGSFKTGDRAALMVEISPSSTIVVDADAIPDWLLSNETPARLLVKASRSDDHSSLKLDLVGAATEANVSSYEYGLAQQRKAHEKNLAAAAAAKSRKGRSTLSGLSGPIGRGGSGRFAPANTRAPRTWSLPSSEVTPIYAAFIKKQNSRLTNAEAMRIAEGIVGFSLHYEVDARLIMAMVMVESGFDPNAVSHSGAMGLGQLMPGTADWMKVQDPFDSLDNLSGTVKLVRTHLDQYKAQTGKDFDALVLSLAAYNAGSGAVKRAGGVPAYRETQNYVRKVIALYYRFAGITA